MSEALFLFAHPDDEFAIYPIIQAEACKGLRCFYLTDGSFRNKGSIIRIIETRNVHRRLGVDPKALNFVGVERCIPDGSLHENLSVAFESILSKNINIEDIRSLYIPAWEGGHQDHDAVHLIGLVVAEHFNLLNRCFQFSLYHGANLPGPFFKVMSPLPENGPASITKISLGNRLKYLFLCLNYPSQIRSWIGLFPLVFLRYLFTGQQYLQKVNILRIFESPHVGKLLYERRGFLQQEQFIANVSYFIDKYLKQISEV